MAEILWNCACYYVCFELCLGFSGLFVYSEDSYIAYIRDMYFVVNNMSN